MRPFDWSGLSLQTENYRVIETDVFDAPSINITSADPVRTDGLMQLYRTLKARTINVKGLVLGADQASADAALDLIKKRFYSRRGKGTLGVGFADHTRYFDGGIQNFGISRSNVDVSRMAYSFQLQTEKPYAYDSLGAQTFVSSTAITTAYATLATMNNGTYLAAPVITIQFTTVPSGSAAGTFSVKNPDTGETLTFDATVKNGDTITIDCAAVQVFQNSTEIFAQGLFPEWLPECGLLEYTDTLASRTASLSATYMRRWL